MRPNHTLDDWQIEGRERRGLGRIQAKFKLAVLQDLMWQCTQLCKPSQMPCDQVFRVRKAEGWAQFVCAIFRFDRSTEKQSLLVTFQMVQSPFQSTEAAFHQTLAFDRINHVTMPFLPRAQKCWMMQFAVVADRTLRRILLINCVCSQKFDMYGSTNTLHCMFGHQSVVADAWEFPNLHLSNSSTQHPPPLTLHTASLIEHTCAVYQSPWFRLLHLPAHCHDPGICHAK